MDLSQIRRPDDDYSPEPPALTPDLDPARLEPQIQAFGKVLFAAMSDKRPSPLRADRWQEAALEWAMRDESFKVRMFRFVDVFPTLQSPDQIAKHLQEYFDHDRGGAPPPISWALRNARPGRLGTSLLSRVVERNVRAMAGRFIAGRDAAAALGALRKLWVRGMAFTLDVLGEACLSQEEAVEYQSRYMDLLDVLPHAVAAWPRNPVLDDAPWGHPPRLNISLKITSLYSQIDPLDFEGSRAAILEAIRPIARLARERGAFLNLDLEQFRYRDLTYAVFRDLLGEEEFRDWNQAGVVIQAYLRDSEQDMLGLLEFARRRGTPITVRLVKGAYWDYETILAEQEHWLVPVFTRKADTDAQYERLTRLLIANWESLHPALATHNIRSMAHGLAVAETLGVPRSALEIQMLHGMADPVKKAVLAQGVRLREYVPVGEVIPGMAYLVRRLLENTANESFLRQTFVEGAERDRLLAPPPPPEDALTPPARPFAGGRPASAARPGAPPPFRNEPHLDFSREGDRRSFAAGLAAARSRMGAHYPLLIGGREVETDRTISSLNPARPEEVVGTVASAREAEAELAVRTAVEAFPSWRDTPPGKRAEILLRAAELIRKDRRRLAGIEVIEAGKPWREADADVTEAIDMLEYYGREMLRLAEPKRLHDIPGERDLYFYEPRGVAVVIAPWNFPLSILAGMTSAALVAGNPAIMKPANPTPVIAWEFARAMFEAGLPERVLSFLPGPGSEVGSFLVRHPGIDLIAFTGSLQTGLFILSESAKVHPGQRSVKRAITEMGGKNAIIVDSDADLDAAVEGIVTSAFNYAGQKCSACSRVIVLEPLYRQLLARLVPAAASLKVGDPMDPGTRVGPVINADAFATVHRYIETGKGEAALALAASAPDDGYYVGPHIFTEVEPSAVIAQEEIFGPVLAVTRAKDFDQALEIANGTGYALTGGLFSRSPRHIRRAYQEFRVGNLYINRNITGAMAGRQPFGGSRMSGVGSKAGGPDYLLQFMEPRVVTENTVRRGFSPSDELAEGL